MDAKIICALSSRLGWGAMQAKVAIPAIIRIITSYINVVGDLTGDNLTPEDAVDILMSWKSNAIFDLLIEDSGVLFGTSRLHELRGEIEECMMEGLDYVDAINEWYK